MEDDDNVDGNDVKVDVKYYDNDDNNDNDTGVVVVMMMRVMMMMMTTMAATMMAMTMTLLFRVKWNSFRVVVWNKRGVLHFISL